MTLVTFNKKQDNERVNYGLNPLFKEVFNDFFSEGTNLNLFYGKLAATNTYETDKSYHLEISTPGFEKTDFKIKLENGMITVSADKKQENTTTEKNYVKREFNYQKFERSFTLPNNIDDEKILAEYKNGILIIELPKKANDIKNSKEINIF